MGIKIADFDPFDFTDGLPEIVEPEGGWKEATCDWNTHRWGIELDHGNVVVKCLDPCDISQFDPAKPWPCCASDVFYAEDCYTVNPIEVKLNFVDDSTSDSWLGPAEYSFYIEVYNTTDEVPRESTN